jgi:hypothetical protein
MKKQNLTLFIILISLITFAYFYEEKGKAQKEKIKVEAKSLITVDGTITKIKTDSFHLEKDKSNNWNIRDEERKVNLQYVELIERVLKGLVIQGEVKDLKQKEAFFKHRKKSIEVTSNKTKYHLVIGDVSELTGNFYVLKDNKKLYIVSDDSLYDQPYKTEFDLKLKKYIRLRNILNLKSFDLVNQSLLYGIELDKIKSIKIDSKRNRWFQIDLEKDLTTPAIYTGINYKNLKKYSLFLLNKFKVKREIKQNTEFISNEMGHIQLQTDTKRIDLHLYSSLNGQFGRYVKLSEGKKVKFFEIREVSKNMFYMNVQDFWNKTFIHNIDFTQIKNFEFQLGHNFENLKSFTVSDVKTKFKISSKDKKLEYQEFKINFCFNLLLNLVDFTEAKYVEEKIDIKKNKSDVYFLLFGKTFGISKKKNLITVVDHSLRIKYHFNYISEPIPDDFFKSFFTVE